MRDENGAESAPFDGETLLACARKGSIQPATPIYDVAASRWMPAAEHVLLGGAPAPIPTPATPAAALAPSAPSPQPAYVPYAPAPPVVRTSGGSSSNTMVLACVVAGAVFMLVFGILSEFKKPAQSKPILAGPIQTITTVDGHYAINVPADWIRWKTRRADVIEYSNADHLSGIAMVKTTETQTNAAGLLALTNKTMLKETRHMNGEFTGNLKPISVKGYPGYQQDMRTGNLFREHQFRSTILQTPNGAYSLVSFVDNGAHDSLSDLDAIVKTFHSLPSNSAALTPKKS
ncbi:hypothetical protein [Capsulimonas corticalis]|nr:hypothetical protein [Capsulimonas corticalis]